jgi:RNA polymerase-binding transcription factor DksA
MKVAHPLTRLQLRDLENELRAERARVERSIATRMGADNAVPTAGSVFGGRTHAEGGLAVALETRILDRRQVLDSAIQRLEAGTYGVCVGCHNPIPYGRLLAMPEAAYCVGCGAAA